MINTRKGSVALAWPAARPQPPLPVPVSGQAIRPGPRFEVRLADTPAEIAAAQRLRYRVFVEELGGDGPLVDHRRGLERDRFDSHADHLILTADSRPGEVVGTYRLMRQDQAARAGQFYSEDEYDLGVLRASGRTLLELGRSCLDPGFRGGSAMYHLWGGLAQYVAAHGIGILFGVASFPGTDTARLAAPLSLLRHRHLAPPGLRVSVKQPSCRMDLIPPADLDRRTAMLQVPPLIKAYLKLGGHVGDGAFIDHRFNTTDVCLVLDTRRIRETPRALPDRDGCAG